MEIIEGIIYSESAKIYENVNKALFRMKFLADSHPKFNNFNESKMEIYLERANKVLQLENSDLKIEPHDLIPNAGMRKQSKTALNSNLGKMAQSSDKLK